MPGQRIENDAGSGLLEAARIEAARQARLDKIPALRRIVVTLCESRSQCSLAAEISWSPVYLAQFMTGKRNGKVINRISMNALHSTLTSALARAGLPSTEFELEPGHREAPAPPPPPPPPLPPPTRQPLPVWSVKIGDAGGDHSGGLLHIMSIGVPPIRDDDLDGPELWAYPCPARGGAEDGLVLRLRLGLRGRITFGARVTGLGGRTFEWEIERLHAPLEPEVHNGPLWVARELTGTVNDLNAERIIGRAVGRGTGRYVGASCPARMWRAVEAKVAAKKQDALASLRAAGSHTLRCRPRLRWPTRRPRSLWHRPSARARAGWPG